MQFFLHRDQFAVRCGDIADIKPDFDDSGYAVIVFTLKDGGQKSLVIGALNRSHHEIAARLRAACGLPEDPKTRTPGSRGRRDYFRLNRAAKKSPLFHCGAAAGSIGAGILANKFGPTRAHLGWEFDKLRRGR